VQAQDRVRLGAEKDVQEQPVIFVGHGDPMVAIEYDEWSENLISFIEKFPKPTAIIVLSAHWTTDNSIRITSSEIPDQLYEFEGFPDTLYQLTYPCDGDPELANMLLDLMSDIGLEVVLDNDRGIDHGAWIPLYVAFPNADIPVIEISLPLLATPKQIMNVGTALTVLRKQGVLLIGSGNLVFNLSLADQANKYKDPEKWTKETDEWIDQNLKEANIEALLNYHATMPNLEKAIPTLEHFLPMFFVLGAMQQKDHYVTIYDGYHYGTVSMRSFAFTSN
jgi:4,5-DOPA dioxygenase extradiol